MAKRLIPCLDRVLVEKIVPPSKTTASILLPEKSSKLNSGKVVAVGPVTRDKSGNTNPVGVKEGDTVLLPEYGGIAVKLGETQYHLFRSIRMHATHREITGPLQSRFFQPDFVPADPNAKPKKYKLPASYDPYGPRPPPSDKIVQLADKIASLPPEERMQIGPTLRERLRHPKMQSISVEGVDLGAQGGSGAGSAKAEEKAEKTAFDIKLEKLIKEVRAFTNLGLKEAKDMVEKVPVVIKQGVTKEEANEIIEKIKTAGGVAVME